ncbi:MAG: class I SAM-dependent methyltransferase [Magnetococcales bacterium]|nr:class I SAM-dependent methyltransferase [Magnetococcales bacterium]
MKMQTCCPICGAEAISRLANARSGKEIVLWHCEFCDYDFLVHDPTKDLADNKLDDSRLKSAGLDIPTLERDFKNGLAQSRPYISEYLNADDCNTNILEIGCSWGYFLQLVREAGANPYGIELNTIRSKYVSETLRIPCDTTLEACETRGIKFRKIFLFYVLEYIPDPLDYLQRLVSLLEDGGELIVITPNLSDAIKDLWQNSAFQKFFYDEHAINYMSFCAVEKMVAKLPKSYAKVESRQGYSFVNHLNWYLTQKPRTTGIVGGDRFIEDIVSQLQSENAALNVEQTQIIDRLLSLMVNFDKEYRAVLEQGNYGNQIRFVVKR